MQKDHLLKQKSSTGSMTLFNPNCHFRTCGCLKALTSTTFLKKHFVKISSQVQDFYIFEAHFEPPCITYGLNVITNTFELNINFISLVFITISIVFVFIYC